MDAFTLNELLARARSSDGDFNEFLRRDSMSCGIYRLPGGGEDDQVPHHEDEIYLVLRGSGRLRVGDEDVTVSPGSLIYVPALVEHRFHDFAEDLEILVIFVPAYTGRHQEG